MDLAKKKNIPLAQPDPALVKARDEFVAHDLDNTIRTAKQTLGIDDAAQFVTDYKRIYAKYAEAVAPIADDPHKLAELIYNEVYAKLDPKTAGVK